MPRTNRKQYRDIESLIVSSEQAETCAERIRVLEDRIETLTRERDEARREADHNNRMFRTTDGE